MIPNRYRLELEQDRVAAARRHFNKGRRYCKGTCRLNFDKLLNLFADLRMNFSMISKKAGLTSAGVNYLYRRHFQEVFSTATNGVERMRLLRERRQQERLQRKKERDWKDLLWEEIRRRTGYVVERGISLHQATINGRRCSIVRLRRAKNVPGMKRRYFHWYVRTESLRRKSCVVVRCAAPGHRIRYFVIPTRIVRGATNNGRSIYLPTKYWPPYRNRAPRRNWLQYQERWQALR